MKSVCLEAGWQRGAGVRKVEIAFLVFSRVAL